MPRRPSKYPKILYFSKGGVAVQYKKRGRSSNFWTLDPLKSIKFRRVKK